jgi:hypothetical protein
MTFEQWFQAKRHELRICYMRDCGRNALGMTGQVEFMQWANAQFALEQADSADAQRSET